MNRIAFLFALLLATHSIFAQRLTADNIDKVVKQLTLDEKINIVVGVGLYIPGISPEEDKFNEKVPGAAGQSYSIERIGLPPIVLADGPAGVRINPNRPNDNQKYYATAFPISTLMASTWDLNLMQEVGLAFGNECKEFGVDILLAPALNIHRNPLTGRNFEYYSEDPLLAGKMAASFVKGVQQQGVGTSIKHFAANNQETNRSSVNEIISERAMREIYLKGFEIAVKEAQPWTVMSAYNKINGIFSSQRHDMLTSVLRDEWGFNGFVMTDWFAGDNATEQMIAGNDLLMPGMKHQKDSIRNAVKSGKLPVETLDINVKRILTIYTKTLSFNGYKPSGKPNSEANAALVRKAAAEGMILLENNTKTLPLKAESKVALFGNSSYETIIGGTGSGDVNNADEVTLLEGFINNGIQYHKPLSDEYEAYINDAHDKMPKKTFSFGPEKRIEEKSWTADLVRQIAQDTDVAIYVLGRESGEFADRVMDNDYQLSDTELATIKMLSEEYHAAGKKLVVVLNIGGVIETKSWSSLADAVLLVWQPGQEAGNAICDVLTGKVNPSGKLPMTFPIKYEDHKSSENFPGKTFDLPAEGGIEFMKAKPAQVEYKEGIFVGYRHFESANIKTAYPFGYGLSYTSFEYSKLKLRKTTTGYDIQCKVKNTGDVAGKEVAQLYISAPQTGLAKPLRELKGFQKTKLLKPGETQTLSFSISLYDISSYHTDRSAWIAGKGEYKIQIGSSVSDIKLESPIALDSDKLTSDVENQFTEIDLKLKEKEKARKAAAAGRPSHATRVYRNVEWAVAKGFSLTMDIHVPQTGKESYPVLVVYHGGGWLMNNNGIMEQASDYIASRGEYIVCNVNYRLLGDNNNTTTIYEIIEDVFGALLWVKENIAAYKGDPKRVSVTGDSAGGHLSSCILNMGRNLSSKGFSPDNLQFNPTFLPKGKTAEQVAREDMLKVQAAIISYGAFDIYGNCKYGNFESKENIFWTFGGVEARGLFGNAYTVDSHPEIYKAVSPVYNLPNASEYKLPPQLFTVGSHDNTTTPSSIKEYVEKVKAAGQSAELWINEGRPHAFLDSGSNDYLGISFEKDAIEALNVMIDFLDGIFYK